MTVHFRGGMSAGDIAQRFHHAWPTISRHLGVLKGAGLLREERQGRTRLYRVDRERLSLVYEWLSWFELERRPSTPTMEKSDASKEEH
jgi:DNA-binding transcriptional ArsR family regulator